jgi:hypothetical protein
VIHWFTFKLASYSFQELNNFKQITFKNLVTFYRDELERLLNGEASKQVLSKGNRKMLRRLGILVLKPTGDTGRLLEVSSSSRDLEDLVRVHVKSYILSIFNVILWSEYTRSTDG